MRWLFAGIDVHVCNSLCPVNTIWDNLEGASPLQCFQEGNFYADTLI